MRAYHCPTMVYTRQRLSIDLANLVDAREPLLLSSPGWLRRGIAEVVAAQLPGLAISDGVASHPKVSDVVALEQTLPEFDALIAVGGGSVIDAAKAVVALRALGGDAGTLRGVLAGATHLPSSLPCALLIAVPTTCGTGSEVTPWATLWGDQRQKFSLSHPDLYPRAALLDSFLCTSLPTEVTLASGLDALSHAMEAIWNRHNAPASDFAAAASIRRLRCVLPRVLEDPGSIALRRDMQIAALYAGFAMGTTQTALSHSISYPLTAVFGLPHGFACSLTLGEVARFNTAQDPSRLAVVADAFGCDVTSLPEEIHQWMKAIRVPDHLRVYLPPRPPEIPGDELINPARAGNNLRPASGAEAREILGRSMHALLETG